METIATIDLLIQIKERSKELDRRRSLPVYKSDLRGILAGGFNIEKTLKPNTYYYVDLKNNCVFRKFEEDTHRLSSKDCMYCGRRE